MGQVAQDMPETRQRANDFVEEGDATLRAAQQEVTASEATDDYDRMAHAYMALQDAGAHDAPARAQALILGLVDGLGDARGVMRARFGEEVELRLVPAPGRGGWLRFVLPSASICEAGGPPLICADDILAALEARALWARYGL